MAPPLAAWTFTVPEAWAIEGNDTMTGAEALRDATRDEVTDHTSVAMEQDDRSATAFLEIVQPRSVDCDETIDRPVVVPRKRKPHNSTPAKTRDKRSCASLRVHHP